MKILALQGVPPIRAKIMSKDNSLEQVRNVSMKLSNFNYICVRIERELHGKMRTAAILKQ